jgi:2-keto-3-deoxy-L-rhamnonate aldolase RhmA
MPRSATVSALKLNPPLRRNRLKDDLAQGRALLGTSVRIASNPAIAVLLSAAGLDYLELELDQSAMTTEQLADIALAARAADLPAIVRPGAKYKGTYGPFLEAGAWGLSLEIDSVADALDAVRVTRHAPMGLRGTFEPGPQNDYQSDPQDLTALNEQVHITARLGTAKACEQASDIVAIAGIDAVELDRERLGRSLGAGDNRAAIDSLHKSICAAARRHDKKVSASAESESDLARLADMGIQMLRYRSDGEILADGFARAINGAYALQGNKS